MLGVELGDDIDMSSPDEVLQRAHARMEEQHTHEAAPTQAAEARRAKRKKSAKQLAAQAKQEAEQEATGNSTTLETRLRQLPDVSFVMR